MAGWNFRVSNRNKWEVRMEGKTSRLPKPRRFRMRRKPNKLGEWRSVVSKWEFVMSPRATVISSCRCLLNSVADIEDLTKGQYLYKVRSKTLRGKTHTIIFCYTRENMNFHHIILWKLLIWRFLLYIWGPATCILWAVRFFVTLWSATGSVSWNLVFCNWILHIWNGFYTWCQ